MSWQPQNPPRPEDWLPYFAAHAPAAPDWFVHEPYPDTCGKKPLPSQFLERPAVLDILNAMTEDDRRQAVGWFEDACYDPEQYDLGTLMEKFVSLARAFWQKQRAWEDDRNEWEREDAAARFFQWRRHYAHALLAEMRRPQVKQTATFPVGTTTAAVLRDLVVEMLERAEDANRQVGEYDPDPFPPALLERARQALNMTQPQDTR